MKKSNKHKLDSNNKVMSLTSNLPHLQGTDYAKHLNKDSKYLNLELQKKRRSRSKSFGAKSGDKSAKNEGFVSELLKAEQQRENSTDDDMPQEVDDIVDDDGPQINRVTDYNHVEMTKPLDSKQTIQSSKAADPSEEKERFKTEFQKQIPMSLKEVKDLSVQKVKEKVAVSLAG